MLACYSFPAQYENMYTNYELSHIYQCLTHSSASTSHASSVYNLWLPKWLLLAKYFSELCTIFSIMSQLLHRNRKNPVIFFNRWEFARHSLHLAALTLSVGWRKGVWPVKALHQNPLAMVDDISGWGRGCSTLWQPHLRVNATEMAAGLPMFSSKMSVKRMCMYVSLHLAIALAGSLLWPCASECHSVKMCVHLFTFSQRIIIYNADRSWSVIH